MDSAGRSAFGRAFRGSVAYSKGAAAMSVKQQAAKPEQAASQPLVSGAALRYLRMAGLILPMLLLVVNIAMWAMTVSAMGGPEVLVRRADFVSNLTGATL